jgi:hypothetical protein
MACPPKRRTRLSAPIFICLRFAAANKRFCCHPSRSLCKEENNVVLIKFLITLPDYNALSQRERNIQNQNEISLPINSVTALDLLWS